MSVTVSKRNKSVAFLWFVNLEQLQRTNGPFVTSVVFNRKHSCALSPQKLILLSFLFLYCEKLLKHHLKW